MSIILLLFLYNSSIVSTYDSAIIERKNKNCPLAVFGMSCLIDIKLYPTPYLGSNTSCISASYSCPIINSAIIPLTTNVPYCSSTCTGTSSLVLHEYILKSEGVFGYISCWGVSFNLIVSSIDILSPFKKTLLFYLYFSCALRRSK